jgi:hypothetical protein
MCNNVYAIIEKIKRRAKPMLTDVKKISKDPFCELYS